MITASNLRRLARTNKLRVEFTKLDGSTRIMECTLKNEYLPDAYAFNDDAELLAESDHNAVAVWDLNNDGWRSIKPDSIKSISILNEDWVQPGSNPPDYFWSNSLNIEFPMSFEVIHVFCNWG